MSNAVLLGPAEGHPLSFNLGITTVIKATGEATGGAWTAIESTIAPRNTGLKAHTHERTAEAFYLLEGRLTFRLDEREFQAAPGSFVLIPPGMRHTFANHADAPAKYLLIITPAGFEKYLTELAAMMARESEWPPANPDSLAALRALAEQYDASIE